MRTRLAAAAALGATAVLTAPAHATTTEDCGALVADLASATRTTLDGKPEDSLAPKADAAGAKLAVGKVDDALAKLADYDEALQALAEARKPKVSADHFALLHGLVHTAVTCVQDIETP